MKSITTWIITGVLLAGAAVSYISKEYSDSNENQSLSADVADVESETSTPKDKEGIRPEDIIHYDPKAIGKSVVEWDGIVYVDLEGEGSSDDTKELKPFQKWGYLEFNGKVQIEFNPSYFEREGYEWWIIMQFHKWNERLGTAVFPWGKVTVLEPTSGFMDFGSMKSCEVNYYHNCRDKHGREDDDEIEKFAKQSAKSSADSLGVFCVVSLVRKSDEWTGSYSGEF